MKTTKGYLFDFITEELLETVEELQEIGTIIIIEEFTEDGYYSLTVIAELSDLVTVEDLLAPLV